jgi:hypothetical protein
MKSKISRRRLLSGLSLSAAMAGAITPGTILAETENAGNNTSQRFLNVRDFGAAGDGAKDDTAAFVAAMKAVSDSGSLSLFVPRGRYLIAGNLDIPNSVTVEGVFAAPSGRTHEHGSVLLVTAGAGDAKGKPFITMRGSSTLRGLTIFYPEQQKKNPHCHLVKEEWKKSMYFVFPFCFQTVDARSITTLDRIN